MSPESIVLVTGATGFIGREVCRQLIARGTSVRGLIRPGRHQPEGLDGVAWCVGDLLQAKSLIPACEGVDAVIHLAAQAQVDKVDARQTMRVNRDGSENLLGAAQARGIRRFVFVSSILAARTKGAASSNPYGVAKLAAETLIRKRLASGRPDFVILRPVNVYGPGMAGNLLQLIKAIRSGVMPRFPEMPARLSLIARTDLTRVILESLTNKTMTGNTYIVSDGVQYRFNELERDIYRAAGRRYPRWPTPRVLLYAAASVADLLSRATGRKTGARQSLRRLEESIAVSNEQLVRDTGFRPSETFRGALPAIIESIQQGKNASAPRGR